MLIDSVLKRLILSATLIVFLLPLYSQEERVYKSPIYEDDWSLPGKHQSFENGIN
jgi:hypothetical protein